MLRKLSALLCLGLTLLASGQATAQLAGGRGIPILAAPTIFSAPQADPFDGGVGTVNLRAYQGGGWTYMAAQSANTNTTAVGVNGSGLLSGSLSNTGGNANVTYVQTAYPADDTVWITLTSGRSLTTTFNQNNIIISPLYTGSGADNSFNHSSVTWSASGNSGALNLKKDLATASANACGSCNVTGGSAANVQFLPGDTIQIRQKRVGANLIWDWWQNGVQLRDGTTGTAFNFTTSGITDAKMFGIYGAIGAGALDRVEFCRPLIDACLSYRNAARVVQKESDGSVILKLRAEYTRTAPKALYYTLYDASNDTAVAGHIGVPWTDYQAAAGVASGKSQKITSPPASFYVVIERRDVAGGTGKAISTGPPIKAGDVWLTYGQSLNQQLDDTDNGAATGSAQSANGWSISARNDSTYGTEEQQRTLRFAANTPNARRYDAYVTGSGLTTPPIGMFMGGKGGTYLRERIPGASTGIFQALLDGIDRNGGDFSLMIDISGTFEAVGGSTEYNNYETNQLLIMNALEAKVGHSVPVMLNPVGTIWDITSANVEAVRRIQYKLVHDYPTRIFLGPASYDLTHDGTQYHLAKTSYGEHGRRIGYQVAFLKGASVAAADRTGLFIDSGQVINSTTIRIRYNLNGADGLTITNTPTAGTSSYAWLGGQAFSTTSCAAARVDTPPINPTNAVVGTPSGGFVTVDYTVPSVSAGSVWWRGPYGGNPFNKGLGAAETTINGNMSLAPMVKDTRVNGEPGLPLQPYYNWSGPTDGSQDCLNF